MNKRHFKVCSEWVISCDPFLIFLFSPQKHSQKVCVPVLKYQYIAIWNGSVYVMFLYFHRGYSGYCLWSSLCGHAVGLLHVCLSTTEKVLKVCVSAHVKVDI